MSPFESIVVSVMSFMLLIYVAQAILSFRITTGAVYLMCSGFVAYHCKNVLPHSFNRRILTYCAMVVVATMVGWLYMSVLLIAQYTISEIFVYLLKRKTLQLTKELQEQQRALEKLK